MALGRVPTRPLDFANKSKATNKEILVNYTTGDLYMKTDTGTIVKLSTRLTTESITIPALATPRVGDAKPVSAWTPTQYISHIYQNNDRFKYDLVSGSFVGTIAVTDPILFLEYINAVEGRYVFKYLGASDGWDITFPDEFVKHLSDINLCGIGWSASHSGQTNSEFSITYDKKRCHLMYNYAPDTTGTASERSVSGEVDIELFSSAFDVNTYHFDALATEVVTNVSINANNVGITEVPVVDHGIFISRTRRSYDEFATNVFTYVNNGVDRYWDMNAGQERIDDITYMGIYTLEIPVHGDIIYVATDRFFLESALGANNTGVTTLPNFDMSTMESYLYDAELIDIDNPADLMMTLRYDTTDWRVFIGEEELSHVATADIGMDIGAQTPAANDTVILNIRPSFAWFCTTEGYEDRHDYIDDIGVTIQGVAIVGDSFNVIYTNSDVVVDQIEYGAPFYQDIEYAGILYTSDVVQIAPDFDTSESDLNIIGAYIDDYNKLYGLVSTKPSSGNGKFTVYAVAPTNFDLQVKITLDRVAVV